MSSHLKSVFLAVSLIGIPDALPAIAQSSTTQFIPAISAVDLVSQASLVLANNDFVNSALTDPEGYKPVALPLLLVW